MNQDNTTGTQPNHIDSRPPPRRTRRLLMATALAAGTIAVGFSAQQASAIVAGEPTTAANNPWQVALTSDGEQFCGGSLVSDRIVVTAAHCVVGTPTSAITIRAGVTDLSAGDGQLRNVVTVIEQPKYVTGTGDIAMLVLDRPVDFSSTVAAIPTATNDEIANVTTASVSGWGVTSEQGDDSPSVLQSADVPLIDDATCSPLGIDPADELCAGGTGTDSCYGDSGGPLIVQSSRGPVLAGVVSWGEECGGQSPGVYAEVPTFADWIADRVADPEAPAPERLPTDAGEFDEFNANWDDEYNENWDDEYDEYNWDNEYDENFWTDDNWDDEYDENFWTDDNEYDEYDENFWTDDNEYDEYDEFWDDDNWDDEYDEFWDDDAGWDGYNDDMSFADDGYWSDDF